MSGRPARPDAGTPAAPAARRRRPAPTIQPKVQIRLLPIGSPIISARTVLTRCEIGLTLTNACSQPGIVSVSTNVLLPKLSGSTSRNMIPCTAPGVRAIIPTNTEIQQKHSAKAMEIATAASTSSAEVSTRKPIRKPNDEGDHAQDQIPREVGEDGADQRGRAGDRQRPEPVEDALLDVGVEVLAQRDAGHRDRLAEQAGQQELQVVVLRAARDGATEDVGEHHQEDDRLQGDVDQRLRRAPGLDQAALGEGERVPEPLRCGEARGRGRFGRIGQSCPSGVLQGRGASCCRPRRSTRRCGLPVRVRKTSSRLGRCRDSSVTAMPASAEAGHRRGEGALAVDGDGQPVAAGVLGLACRRSRRGSGARPRAGSGRSGGPRSAARRRPA